MATPPSLLLPSRLPVVAGFKSLDERDPQGRERFLVLRDR